MVVGAGGAGLAAAIAAFDGGAERVTVLEAADEAGGSTARSAGSFMAAGTSVQAAAGHPDDTPDALLTYLETVSQWDLDVPVARRLAHESAPTLDWLMGLGIEFPVEGLYRAGLEPVPRSHRARGNGRGLVDPLLAACRDRAIEILVGTRVDGLLTDDDQLVGDPGSGPTVIGVSSDGGEHLHLAQAVILTTGGFGHDPARLARHIPAVGDEATATASMAWSPVAPTCRGDALAFADSVGASLTGEDRAVIRLNPSFPVDELYVPPWVLLVDDAGRRFVSESAPPQAFRALVEPRGGRCWAIFDEEARRAHVGAVPGRGWADAVVEELDGGGAFAASSVAALAEATGLPHRALEATIARYNDGAARGRDAYGKSADLLHAVGDGPIYAIELRPQVVLITGYGLRIDPDARVLDAADEPVRQLYAAGEVTANVLGARYPGQGSAITNCLVFGRIAGTQAAREIGGPDAGRTT